MFEQLLRDLLLIAFVLSLFRLLISGKKNNRIIERMIYLVFILTVVSVIAHELNWQQLSVRSEEVPVNDLEAKYVKLSEQVWVADLDTTFAQVIQIVCQDLGDTEFIAVEVRHPLNIETFNISVTLHTIKEQEAITAIEKVFLERYAIEKDAFNFIFK